MMVPPFQVSVIQSDSQCLSENHQKAKHSTVNPENVQQGFAAWNRASSPLS